MRVAEGTADEHGGAVTDVAGDEGVGKGGSADVLKELLEGMRKPPTGTGPGAARAASQLARRREAAMRRR